MLRVASPSSRRRTLTLLDCCSASAALLLPPRAAATAKLGLMSLGHALGRAHLGEAAMGLRETQLTRWVPGGGGSAAASMGKVACVLNM